MIRNPPSPLYTDPVHLAPSDPTVVEGPDGRWWMFYTQRRAGDTGPGVTWVHGTDIAVASSDDGGLTWTYAGVVDGLDPNPGRNTLWAPEVIFAEGRYHMFATYISGMPSRWSGHERHILHHVSDDLVHWDHLGVISLSSDHVIDAAVHPRPTGGYRMWFKDEANQSWTWASDSDDLQSWGQAFPVITGPGHEGPNVFALGSAFWMIVDEWHGLAVYTSPDLDTWQRQGLILDRPGRRPGDHTIGRHADVVVGRDADNTEVGWIFYFTHRVDRDDEDSPGHTEQRLAIEEHRTDIQAAELRVVDGQLICDRDAAFDLDLRRASRYAHSTAATCQPNRA
jgi:hypothetical protein